MSWKQAFYGSKWFKRQRLISEIAPFITAPIQSVQLVSTIGTTLGTTQTRGKKMFGKKEAGNIIKIRFWSASFSLLYFLSLSLNFDYCKMNGNVFSFFHFLSLETDRRLFLVLICLYRRPRCRCRHCRRQTTATTTSFASSVLPGQKKKKKNKAKNILLSLLPRNWTTTARSTLLFFFSFSTASISIDVSILISSLLELLMCNCD